MKKVIIILFMAIILVGCSPKTGINYDKTKFKIGDYDVYYMKNYNSDECSDSIELAIPNGEYYYIELIEKCEEEGYVIAINSEYKLLSVALNDEDITYQEVIESSVGRDLPVPTNDNPTKNKDAITDEFAKINHADLSYINYVDGYFFYYSDKYTQCENDISFSFGDYEFTFNKGCNNNFNNLGIVAVRNGVTYELQDLIADKRLDLDNFYKEVYLYRNSIM